MADFLDILRQAALIGGAGLSAYRPPSGPHGSAPSPAPIGAMLTAGGTLLGEAQEKRRERSLSNTLAALDKGDIDLAEAQKRYADQGQYTSENAKLLRQIVDSRYQRQMTEPVAEFITGTGSGAQEPRPFYTGPMNPQLSAGTQGPPVSPTAETSLFMRPADTSAASQRRRLGELGSTSGGRLQLELMKQGLGGLATRTFEELGQQRRAEMAAAQKAAEEERARLTAQASANAYRIMADHNASYGQKTEAITNLLALQGDESFAFNLHKYPLDRQLALAENARKTMQEQRDQSEFIRKKRARAATEGLYNVSLDPNATPEQKAQAMALAYRWEVPKEVIAQIRDRGQQLIPAVHARLAELGSTPDPMGHYPAGDVAAAFARELEDENKKAAALRRANIEAEVAAENARYWNNPMGEAVAKEYVDPRTMKNPNPDMSRAQKAAAGNYIGLAQTSQERIKSLHQVADYAEIYQVVTSGGLVTKRIAAATGLPEGEIFSGVLWEGGDSDLGSFMARGLSAIPLTWSSLTQNKQGRILNALERAKNGILTIFPKTLGKDVGNTAVVEAERAKELFSQTQPEFTLKLFPPKAGLKLPATLEQAQIQSNILKDMLTNIFARTIAWDPYKDVNSSDWRTYVEMLPEYLRTDEIKAKLKEAYAETGGAPPTGREQVIPPPVPDYMRPYQSQVVTPQQTTPQQTTPQQTTPQQTTPSQAPGKPALPPTLDKFKRNSQQILEDALKGL